MRPLLPSFTVILLLSPNLHAQTTDNVLPGVDVTARNRMANNFSETERTATTHNVIIDQETIRNSAASTLDDLLIEQGIPVEKSPTDYGNTTTTIRGFSTGLHDSEANAHLIFLINGRRSGVTNARQLALNNVERIEIIRGAEMYRYTASSPGGVVNIITRRGGPAPVDGSVEMGYGSYETYKGKGRLNGTVNNFDYSVGVNYRTVNHDYRDGDGDRVRSSRTRDVEGMDLTLGYTFGSRHRIGLESYYHDVGKAWQPAYYDEEEGIMQDPSVAYRRTYMHYLTYDGSSENDRFFWNASYGISHDQYNSYSKPEDKTLYPMGQEVDTEQARASLSYLGDRFDLNAGADYVSYETWNAGSPKPNLGYPVGYPMHKGHTTKDIGAYMTGTLKLMDNRLNLTGSLRYDYYNIKDNFVGDEPFFEDRKGHWYDDFKEAGTRPIRRKFHHLSPAFGASYLATDWLKLRADYTQTYRAPSGRQLFSSDATEGYGAPGDPRLNPEKTHTYEIGFDMSLRHARVAVSYFYSKMRNYITIRGIQDPAAGIGPSAQNGDDRRMAGLELNSDMDIAAAMGYHSFALKPFLNATYMTQRKDLMMRGFDGYPGSYAGSWMPIGGIPRLTMNYGLRFHHFDWKFIANLNFNYFGDTWGGQNPTYIHPDNFRKYGKFTVANLSMRKVLFEFDRNSNLEARVIVNNLFDKAYAYQIDAPENNPYQPGRNYYIGFVYNFLK